MPLCISEQRYTLAQLALNEHKNIPQCNKASFIFYDAHMKISYALFNYSYTRYLSFLIVSMFLSLKINTLKVYFDKIILYLFVAAAFDLKKLISHFIFPCYNPGGINYKQVKHQYVTYSRQRVSQGLASYLCHHIQGVCLLRLMLGSP